MKLQSMTDFVLSVDGNKETITDENRYFTNAATNYAKFLKQPLTLEMFIPCDEEGKPLKELNHDNFNNWELYDSYQKKWMKAKENVLFEGFEIKRLPERISFFKEGRCIITYSFTKDDFLGNSPTIERVSGFDLNLTDNAIKQLGL